MKRICRHFPSGSSPAPSRFVLAGTLLLLCPVVFRDGSFSISLGSDVPPLVAQDGPSNGPKTDGPGVGRPEGRAEVSPEESRERWGKLPPERRKEIQKLFERLRELPAEERRALLERLRAMGSGERREVLRRARGELEFEDDSRQLRRELIQKQLERLPPEERERLRELSPNERRQYVEKKLSERRERILSRLPPSLREKAERMPPREQAEFLRRVRGEQLLRETFTPAEVEKLRRLPPRRLRELFKVSREGGPAPRPDFLSKESWDRWLSLKPFERPRVLRQILDPLPPGTGPRTSPLFRPPRERPEPPPESHEGRSKEGPL